MEITSAKESNWFIAFGLFIFSIALALALYLGYAWAYGSLNPLLWSNTNSFYFICIVSAFLIPLTLNYFVVSKNVELDVLINKVFSIDELVEKKYLDVIFAHYGYVATSGLFFMALVFILRPYSTYIISPFFGVLVAVFYYLIMLVYTLFLIRLARGLINKGKFLYFISMPLIVLFDMQVIELFIRSVPKPT